MPRRGRSSCSRSTPPVPMALPYAVAAGLLETGGHPRRVLATQRCGPIDLVHDCFGLRHCQRDRSRCRDELGPQPSRRLRSVACRGSGPRGSGAGSGGGPGSARHPADVRFLQESARRARLMAGRRGLWRAALGGPFLARHLPRMRRSPVPGPRAWAGRVALSRVRAAARYLGGKLPAKLIARSSQPDKSESSANPSTPT